MPENLNAPFKMTGGVKGKIVEDDFLKCSYIIGKNVHPTKSFLGIFFHISLEEMKKLQEQIRDVTIPVRKINSLLL